jgi:Zn-dependent peptidase ImmA (M78 family)/DNA-binding XRE family transcriptional regulator
VTKPWTETREDSNQGRKMATVNRDTLVLARESRRVTQEELAQRSGFAQGTISKAETGSTEPSDELVAAYAKHLRYPVKFFYETPPTTRLPVVFYRTKKKVDIKHIRAVEAQMRILRMHLFKLLRSVETPPLRVPFVDLARERLSASDVAHELRLRRHLKGPVENMTKLAESLGCFIIQWHFDAPDVDALSMHEDGLPPVIAIDPAMKGDRMRFTIAHELGHVIMHHHLVLPGGDFEAEADEFAAELLMPGEEIRPFLRGLTVERAAQLKMHWRTSMQSIIVRAGDLEAISDEHSAKLWKIMNHLRFKQNEPIEVPREEPSLAKSLASFHMTRLGYSPAQMADMLPWTEEEFARTFLDASAARPLRLVR